MTKLDCRFLPHFLTCPELKEETNARFILLDGWNRLINDLYIANCKEISMTFLSHRNELHACLKITFLEMYRSQHAKSLK